MNNRGAREGTPKTAILLTIHPQRQANRVMNMLQAHGTTTHILTKTTAGQSRPQGSPSHMIWTVYDTDCIQQ